MYDLSPPAVYIHESVVGEARLKARADRVIAALATPVTPVVYADDDLPAMVQDGGLLAARVPMGTLDSIPDPILLFNTFRFDGRREERLAWLKECGVNAGYHGGEALMGYGPFNWWPATLSETDHMQDLVCRPCWRIHFQNGCAHKCHYCGLGGLLATMVNVEDYIQRLDTLIRLHPWQETYLLEDDAEVLCLEPELDCLGRLIEYFGTLEGRYLIIHAKSANVDWMLDLPHNGNTIVVFSISSPTQAREFEPGAASTEERIEAARKLGHAGYTARYKFKPILPLRNWREEADQTIQMIFERSNPDLISLCAFMWLDVADMKRRLDTDLLDPECLAAAEAAGPAMAASRARPFPPEVRAMLYKHHIREVRKHNRDIPLGLSTETLDMWKRLAGVIGSTVGDYVCGCGANSIPWRRKLTCNPYACVEQGPSGGFDKM